MGNRAMLDLKKGPLGEKEKAQLISKMTAQVMENMAGKDSMLRFEEVEVAREIKGKKPEEQNAILDRFAKTLKEEYSFVGEWDPSLKPCTYINEDGEEAKGETIIERKLLEKNVRATVEASVDALLAQVMEMGKAASSGEVSSGHVELGITGNSEFNGAVAMALVENLPEKLGGTVKVDAEKNNSDEYTGKILLSWVGEVGESKVEISLFTGKPIGSQKRA